VRQIVVSDHTTAIVPPRGPLIVWMPQRKAPGVLSGCAHSRAQPDGAQSLRQATTIRRYRRASGGRPCKANTCSGWEQQRISSIGQFHFLPLWCAKAGQVVESTGWARWWEGEGRKGRSGQRQQGWTGLTPWEDADGVACPGSGSEKAAPLFRLNAGEAGAESREHLIEQRKGGGAAGWRLN